MPGHSRRDFLKTGAAVGALGLAGLSLPRRASGGDATRPNILFLLTDDHRADALGCMGHPFLRTPNIDRLALEGVLFRNHFVTTAICCTSRASIFSGRYGGPMDLHRFDKELPEEVWRNSYPMRLREAGYRTGFIGKFGVGNRMPVEDFDFWEGFPGQGSYFEGELGKGTHLTRRMGEQASAFFEGCTPDRPFCLSVSFKAPHSQPEYGDRPFPPDPEDAELYKGVSIPQPKTGDEAHRARLPEFLRESEGRVRRLAWFKDADETSRDYFRLITGVDRSIGVMLRALEERGLADNTVIVFTGDNGYFLGERGFEGKWLMYEESIRTPLVVYDPRLPVDLRGLRLAPMTLNIDIAPTLLDYAGVASKGPMAGKSFRPFVEGRHPEWRTEWFYEHLFKHPKIPKNEGVRTTTHKYIRYVETDPMFEELYDLTQDPLEENNLAQDPAHKEMLAKLRERCERLKAGMV